MSVARHEKKQEKRLARILRRRVHLIGSIGGWAHIQRALRRGK